MGDERLDPVVGGHPRLYADAHHQRNIRSIDIGVDQAGAKKKLARAVAIFTARVVLPTTPLPEPMATMLATPGSGCGPEEPYANVP